MDTTDLFPFSSPNTTIRMAGGMNLHTNMSEEEIAGLKKNLADPGKRWLVLSAENTGEVWVQIRHIAEVQFRDIPTPT